MLCLPKIVEVEFGVKSDLMFVVKDRPKIENHAIKYDGRKEVFVVALIEVNYNSIGLTSASSQNWQNLISIL